MNRFGRAGVVLLPIVVLVSAASVAPAQEAEKAVLLERQADIQAEQAEIGAQIDQLNARLQSLNLEAKELEREIARLGRPPGDSRPDSEDGLAAAADRLELGQDWRKLAGDENKWLADPLAETAIRELHRTGAALQETCDDRRLELAEILAYAQELRIHNGRTFELGNAGSLDAIGTWSEELLQVHLVRMVLLHEIVACFEKKEGGKAGLRKTIEEERKIARERQRRRLLNYLLDLVEKRPDKE
ncbi:MAG: hypothetical protein HY720_20980 [Planctomycetes bacterium]|nr:hypothetical protein [Planctomycetota bacterium]